MKKGRQKPKAIEWITYLMLIPVGLFFSDTAHYVGVLSCMGLGGGIGGLIGLTWRLHSYNKLSPQEKRDLAVREGDERNVVIRDKAGNLSWKVLSLALLAAALIASEFDLSISVLLYGLALLGVIVNWLATLWLNDKM